MHTGLITPTMVHVRKLYMIEVATPKEIQINLRVCACTEQLALLTLPAASSSCSSSASSPHALPQDQPDTPAICQYTRLVSSANAVDL